MREIKEETQSFAAAKTKGLLIGIGLGPGDPELISLKALKALQRADCVVFHLAAGKKSHALTIAENFLTAEQMRLPLIYPMTVENSADSAAYKAALAEFYRDSAAAVGALLASGKTVAALTEGDPLFYSSFMYLYDRLAPDYPTEIIPGISSVAAAAAEARAPLCYRNQIMQILPATLAEDSLAQALAEPREKAFVFIKLGRNLAKIRRLLEQAGLTGRAFYVENASLPQAYAAPLAELSSTHMAPYFSMILVPGVKAEPQSAAASGAAKGKISIIGLGPGSRDMRTACANQALAQADAVLGYQFYINQAAPYAAGQQIFASDNGEETARAAHALELARQGRHVALLSSGDAGIYGMAAAFFEVYEAEKPAAADEEIEIAVEAGISAAFAASARFGAPLGHDFAVISLSDNLKPHSVIAARITAAAKADMAMALYNPVSRRRQRQLKEFISLLRALLPGEAYVGLAHDAGRAGERFHICALAELDAARVTSRTVILIGSSKTRYFEKHGRGFLYTPRRYEA